MPFGSIYLPSPTAPVGSRTGYFLAWKEAELLVVNREYRTVEGSSRLINLKSTMNTNRTYFNWKHLEDFKKL